MGNLQQAIAESTLQTPKAKTGGIRVADYRTLRQLLDVVFAGTPKAVSPTAWATTWLRSNRFYQVEVPANIACPTPKGRATNFLATITAAAEADGAIVIDINKARVGQTASGFLPQVIVVRGHNRYLAEKAAGRPYITAWIGELAAMKLNLLHADNQFGSAELQMKLQDALEEKYPAKKPKGQGQMGGIDWKTRPSVIEVYPLENYLVYRKDDNMYKHTYTADQTKRSVALTGTPQEVKQKYVDINASAVVKMGTVGLDAADMMAGTLFPKLKAGLTPVKERDSISDMESRKVAGGGPGSGRRAGSGINDKMRTFTDPKTGKVTNLDKSPGKYPSYGQRMRAGTGFVNYPGATKKRNKTRPNQPTFEEKTKGGTKSEIAEVMSARVAVGKIVTRYNAAVAAGYQPIAACGCSAPAGMEAVAGVLASALKDKGKAHQIAHWLKSRKK